MPFSVVEVDLLCPCFLTEEIDREVSGKFGDYLVFLLSTLASLQHIKYASLFNGDVHLYIL